MDKSAKFWDRQAKDFGAHAGDIKLDENLDFLHTLNYLTPDDAVLDYGCGAGVVAAGIADRVKQIQAIDVSSAMVEVARGYAAERGIENIDFAQATIFDEWLEKESFDVVMAFRVLHVVADPGAAVRRIGELLRPGGHFISVSACMGDWNPVLRVLVSLAAKLPLLPSGVNVFSLRELEAMLTAAGLEIVERERLDDKLPHYYVVARKL